MRSIVIIILSVLISGSGLAAGYFVGQNWNTESIQNIESEASDLENLLEQEELDPDLEEVAQIIEDSLNSDEDDQEDEEVLNLEDMLIEGIDFDLDIGSDFMFDDNDENNDSSNIKIPPRKRLPVTEGSKSAQLYQNAFIRFSHPNNVVVKGESLTFLELQREDIKVGTLNMYSNPENLELSDFVKKENLIDYFTDAKSKGINADPFSLSTAKEAVKFIKYPELETATIYLIAFDNLVIVAKDYSDDDIIGEYILKSLEKIQ